MTKFETCVSGQTKKKNNQLNSKRKTLPNKSLSTTCLSVVTASNDWFDNNQRFEKVTYRGHTRDIGTISRTSVGCHPVIEFYSSLFGTMKRILIRLLDEHSFFASFAVSCKPVVRSRKCAWTRNITHIDIHENDAGIFPIFIEWLWAPHLLQDA